MNAIKILKEMQAKYASFTSYSDEGTVIRSGDSKVAFRTHFQRPNLFRFGWTYMFRDGLDYHRSFKEVLWCDGAATFVCSDGEQPRVQQSLELGIAGATGVSMGAAQTVSAMLLKEVGGFLFTDLEQASLSTAVSGGRRLYCIEGYHPAGDPCKVLLGQSDLLLREVHMTDENGLATIERRRNVRVDEPIDRKLFQYAESD